MKALVHVLIFLVLAAPAQELAEGDIRSLMQSNNDSLRAHAYLELGKYYFISFRDSDSLRKYSSLALQVVASHENPEFYIKASSYLGVAYFSAGDLESAKQQYRAALKMAEQIKDYSLQADLHNKLGTLYSHLNQKDSSVYHLLQAARIFGLEKNYNALAYAYYGVAHNYAVNEDLTKASAYLKEALVLLDSIPPAYAHTKEIILNFAAQHYLELSTTDSSRIDTVLWYANAGYEIVVAHEMESRKPSYYNVYSSYHQFKSQPRMALSYAEKSLTLSSYLTEDDIFLACMNGAQAASKLGDLAKALDFLNHAETLRVVAEPYFGYQYHEVKYQVFKEVGRFEESMLSLEKMIDFKKILDEASNAKAIRNLESAYDAERKENEIRLLQQEVQIQQADTSRKVWALMSFVALVIAVLIVGRFYYQKRLMEEKEQSTLHKQQLLRSQVNPHFIFNALTSIRGFLLGSVDAKKAVSYLGKFAKLMRMVLDHSSKEWVTLEEELEALKIYLEIQKMKFDYKFDFELRVDPDIDIAQVIVPPLLAQPFVENAIEHGFKDIDYEGHLTLSCISKDELLHFDIQDNGIGIKNVKSVQGHDPKALKIFKERLDALAKSLKVKLQFGIEDLGSGPLGNGTRVHYSLPLIDHHV